MKIGVFDSGVGGKAIANAIQEALPELTVTVHEDKAHLPYGSKTPAELLSLVGPIFQAMIDEGCQVIVVACNTVTTTIITQLREQFDVPMVAVEPMIKPAAALTQNKIIAVCATPATLASRRYAWLKNEFAAGVKVLEPDCSDWAAMVESGQINQTTIAGRISEVLDSGADVMVLACTHYHWIEEEIKVLCRGRARVLQPTRPLIEQLKRVIARL